MPRRYKQDSRTGELVHRQVVESYIGRKLRKDEIVHHINGNKMDNRIQNLRIMTVQAHNILHNQKHPRVKTCIICGKEYEPCGSKRKTSKVCSKECKHQLDILNAIKRKRPINQYSTAGELIKVWDSARDVTNAMGYADSNINKCCNHKIKTAYGYVWKYAE